jgi:ketosteroid isomerase-like protein
MSGTAVAAGVHAIEDLRSQWAPHFNSGKIDELGELFYADDARILPPDHGLVRGRPEIVRFLREARDSGDVNFELGVIDTQVVGDLGYLVGTYVFTNAGVASDGLTLETYRQQDDGSWKCVVDMWHGVPS